jgi:hypothetical protein
VDLGVLLGDRPRRLWCITELGRRALQCVAEGDHAYRLARATPRDRRQPNPHLSLRVACYWLLAAFLIERREQGEVSAVQGWECPGREFQPSEGGTRVRVKLPAAAYISPSRRVLLLPEFGTAPVARFRETLRRLVRHSNQIKRSPHDTNCGRVVVEGHIATRCCTLLAAIPGLPWNSSRY